MTAFLIRRLLGMIPTFFIISFIVFVVIQLPPSNWVTRAVEGVAVDSRHFNSESYKAMVHELQRRYNLDRPFLVQYAGWIAGFLRGDMGESFDYEGLEVVDLLKRTVPYSVLISVLSLLFVYVMGIPIGIYSALHKYSVGDYVATLAGFIGLSIPNFFLALILMVFGLFVLGIPVGQLFSPEFTDAPWGLAKFWDLLSNIWIAILVIGTAGTAGLIRVVRANLLDVLGEPYITAVRAKGLRERTVTIKHAVRIAINPVISGLGMWLPALVSGETIVSIVMNIPTTGPLLFKALDSEDIFLSGSILMVLSIFLLIGNLLADIALATLDPRIRYD